MSWCQAIILGFVQGLTEFLPVSSSGHLEIGQALLGTAGEDNLFFTVVLHVATVLSTLLVLWHEVWGLLKGTFSTAEWNEEKNYVFKIIASMIPVFVVGMFFKDQVEEFFGHGLLTVGICLLVTAVLLAFSEWLNRRRAQRADGAEVGHEISYVDAIFIGLAQAVAVLPGLSRSGTTIATGLICGVKKSAVAQFSFLMVLVPILGEAFLDLVDYLQGDMVVASIGVLPLVLGFISAFLTGCVACKWMISIVRRQRLSWFALYCLCVGVFAIVWQVLQ